MSSPLPSAEHPADLADAPSAPARLLTDYLRRAVADLGASAVGVVPAAGGRPRYFTRTVSAAQLFEDACACASEMLKTQAPTGSGVFGTNRVRAESGGDVRGRLIAVPLKSEHGPPRHILLAVRLLDEPRFGTRDAEKLIALARNLAVLLRAEHARPAPRTKKGHASEQSAPASAVVAVSVVAAPAAIASAIDAPAVEPPSPPPVQLDPTQTVAPRDFATTIASPLGWSEFEKYIRTRETGDRLPGCVLYGDMDGLDELNKLAGLSAGDRAISEVDRVLQRAALPPGSCSCHLSGDRYTVYIPSTTLAQGQRIADQLSKSVSALSVPVNGVPTPLSMSFGVAPLSASDGGLSHTLAAAEAACKAAKDRGHGRHLRGDDDEARIADHLREALEADRIAVFAQPIVRLNGSQSTALYELLVRLTGDDGKYLSPSWFMSAATRYRMLVDLDRAVVRHVLKKLVAERERITRRNLRFSVNLSGPSISDADFLEWLVSSIADARVPGEWLQFEITETAAAANITQTQTLIKRLQERGVQLALDDFGSSVNPFAYLKQFDVKMLKLDGSYVRDLSSNPRSQSVVRGIAQLARAMKIETVAECVEAADVRNRLTELGIDCAQGFLFGRPQPLEEVLAADLDRPVEVWGRRSAR